MVNLNRNLHRARANRNDEFYTQLPDIENELGNYEQHFIGKTIFCNCDDPAWSNFWKYFDFNFEFRGLKKLIATHYEEEKTSYKLEIKAGNNRNKNNRLNPPKISLKENGDFKSDECVKILKEADIVVTNPPFSLFREYIAQLMEHDKKFLIIGNMNAIGYKEIFKLFKNDKIWLGCTNPKEFLKPCGEKKPFGNICWFTNLEIKKRYENLTLYKKYHGNESEYPKYDNCDGIDVGKVKHIPMDYKGMMGVPLSFMSKYNPDQFEIVKFRKGDDDKDLQINGKCPYIRILIKNRNLKTL